MPVVATVSLTLVLPSAVVFVLLKDVNIASAVLVAPFDNASLSRLFMWAPLGSLMALILDPPLAIILQSCFVCFGNTMWPMVLEGGDRQFCALARCSPLAWFLIPPITQYLHNVAYVGQFQKSN